MTGRPRMWADYEEMMIEIYKAGWTPLDIHYVMLDTFGAWIPATTVSTYVRRAGVQMHPRGGIPGRRPRPATEREKILVKIMAHMYFEMDMLASEIVRAVQGRFPEIRTDAQVVGRLRTAGYTLKSRSEQIKKAWDRGYVVRSQSSTHPAAFITKEEAAAVGLTNHAINWNVRRRDLEAALEVHTDERGTSSTDLGCDQGDREGKAA